MWVYSSLGAKKKNNCSFKAVTLEIVPAVENGDWWTRARVGMTRETTSARCWGRPWTVSLYLVCVWSACVDCARPIPV